MSIWWALPAFAGLVGIMMVIGGLAGLFRLRFASGVFRILFGGLTLAGAAIVGLIGLNLQTYARLTHEQLAAEVTITSTAPGRFTATVRKGDDKGLLLEPAAYQLAGDKVRLEARVWKLKPWANVIGEDSFYRFERIQGRWDDPVRENNTPSTADDTIRDDDGIDVFALPLGSYTPFQLDTTFGSGVYMPAVDGAIYEVMMTQSALIVRGRNDIAVNALNTWSNNPAPGPAPPPLDIPPDGPVPLTPPPQQPVQ